MASCKRFYDEKNYYYKLFVFVVVVNTLLCHFIPLTSAHFIQIDHNEFRASGFPRPILPPPLPPIDHLQQQQQHLSAKELTPAEYMVDMTNDLTYRILHYHSILNRNNFAFSPTALVSVLIALYEGAAGRSATELKNVLQLPNNKDVIRVGYRDIHRRLRTYFFGSENPLKGLSLNKDNVTITRAYETILMFYGYDLGMDMVSSVATTTTTPTTATTNEMTTPTTAAPETTTILPTMPDEVTTTSSTSVETTTTTEKPETTKTTIAAETTTTTEKPTTTTSTTETPTTLAATTEAPTETPTVTAPPTTTESEVETDAEAATEEEAAELVSTFVAESTGEPFLRIQKARVTHLPSGRLQAPVKPKTATTTTTNTTPTKSKSARLNNTPAKQMALPGGNYLPATSRSFQSERISIRQGRPKRQLSKQMSKQRRFKRHLYSSYKDGDANLFVSLFQPQPQPQPQTPHHNIYAITGPGTGPEPALAHVTNEFDVQIEPHFVTSIGGGSSPAALNDATEFKQNYNTDIISHVFYLGNQDVIYTTYKVYNAVLYYKYFEQLKMSVLELELDTPEYNLMILLPDYHTDLVQAAASLRLGPTLRVLRKQLKPRWVQAIIPDFKLHGTMFLTNDLQNLGICDIFEPNRADFRPMTDEKGIYVKHIEQSINVNIRTHPINQLRRNYGAAQLHPIQISVNHPFLFYIIDRDLDVAVMAGRILNPLNVRIQ